MKDWQAEAKRFLPDLWAALAYFTRLPGRGAAAGAPSPAPASAWAWPLAGALIGAIAGAAALVLQGAGLAPGLSAVVVLMLLALLSGAQHEAEWTRTAEGLALSGGREDRLAALAPRQPERGLSTTGALALILVTLARWAGLAQLLAMTSPLRAFFLILGLAALSRAPVALIAALLPPMRAEGAVRAPLPLALIGAGIAAGLALPGFLLLPLLAALPALALMTGFVVLLAHTKIGGQTREIWGTGQQLGEVALLAGFLLAY